MRSGSSPPPPPPRKYNLARDTCLCLWLVICPSCRDELLPQGGCSDSSAPRLMSSGSEQRCLQQAQPHPTSGTPHTRAALLFSQASSAHSVSGQQFSGGKHSFCKSNVFPRKKVLVFPQRPSLRLVEPKQSSLRSACHAASRDPSWHRRLLLLTTSPTPRAPACRDEVPVQLGAEAGASRPARRAQPGAWDKQVKFAELRISALIFFFLFLELSIPQKILTS